MYRYILFDLDGTLTNPSEGITKSVQYALTHMGIEEPDLKKLEPFIGPPLMDSFQEYYGFTADEAKKATAWFRKYFRETGIFQNELFPGVPEMLRTLKEQGCVVAIASSKLEVFVQRILEHFAIDSYFDYVCGATIDEKRNKKEEVLEELLRRMNLSAEDRKQILMVGDRKYDVEGAACFGIPCLGLSLGFAAPGELEAAGAAAVVDRVEDITAFVLNS